MQVLRRGAPQIIRHSPGCSDSKPSGYGRHRGPGPKERGKGKGKGQGIGKGLHSGVRASGLAQPYAPPPWRPPRTDQAVSDPASEAPHATDGPPPAGTDGHLDAQIRTLERLRRAARDAGDQQYADLQSQRIAALRKTKAESRPIAARIESAERAHEQAIDSEQKAAQALAHAVEKHTKCQEHLRQTERELAALRELQLLEKKAEEDAKEHRKRKRAAKAALQGKRRSRSPASSHGTGDPEGETLEAADVLAYADELVQALDEAQCRSHFTARVWNAIHTLRGFALAQSAGTAADGEDYAPGTGDDQDQHMDASDQESPEDDADAESESDHTCHSGEGSGHTSIASRSRETLQQDVGRTDTSEPGNAPALPPRQASSSCAGSSAPPKRAPPARKPDEFEISSSAEGRSGRKHAKQKAAGGRAKGRSRSPARAPPY